MVDNGDSSYKRIGTVPDSHAFSVILQLQSHIQQCPATFALRSVARNQWLTMNSIGVSSQRSSILVPSPSTSCSTSSSSPDTPVFSKNPPVDPPPNSLGFSSTPQHVSSSSHHLSPCHFLGTLSLPHSYTSGLVGIQTRDYRS